MAVRFVEAVNRADVWMIQRRQRVRFAPEARHALGVVRERFGKNLEGNVAIEFGVARAIDLAHATGAEQCQDLVGAETGAPASLTLALRSTSVDPVRDVLHHHLLAEIIQ